MQISNLSGKGKDGSPSWIQIVPRNIFTFFLLFSLGRTLSSNLLAVFFIPRRRYKTMEVSSFFSPLYSFFSFYESGSGSEERVRHKTLWEARDFAMFLHNNTHFSHYFLNREKVSKKNPKIHYNSLSWWISCFPWCIQHTIVKQNCGVQEKRDGKDGRSKSGKQASPLFRANRKSGENYDLRRLLFVPSWMEGCN